MSDIDEFVLQRVPKLEGSIAYPSDETGPVFRQPWEAKTFAMVVTLNEKGIFSWETWVDELTKVIAEAAKEDSDEDDSMYYYYWMEALERILGARDISSDADLVSIRARIVDHVNHSHHDQKEQDNTQPIAIG